MLSDKSIVRPWKPSKTRRVLQALKKRVGKHHRMKINKKMQEKFSGEDISIIASFCGGGTLYHDLNQKFLSPTINLAIDGPDFVKLCLNLKYYMSMELIEYKTDEVPYPVGHLGDVEIRFVHYDSFVEAKEKWEERTKRINYDKIFIMACDRDGFNTPECMELFDKIPYKKVMYTSKSYPGYPWTAYCSCFSKYHCVGVMTGYADFKGYKYYEQYADIIALINAVK